MSLFRTAVRASVATRVAGNVHRKQQHRWAAEDQRAQQSQQPQQAAQPVQPEQPAQQAPATAPPAVPDMLQQLAQLGQLRDAGVLTEAEFETQKARILAAG